MYVNCDYCNNLVKKRKDHFKYHKLSFCNRICDNKYRIGKSTSAKGRIRTNNIIFYDKKNRRKYGIKRICLNCNKEFIAFAFQVKKGKGNFCSYKCSSLNRDNKEFLERARRTGPEHHSFIHGKSYENNKNRKKVMSSPIYRKWRKCVFERDNYTCQKCNLKDIILYAHHIIPWIKDESKRFDINNGLTLCNKCHRLEHKKRIQQCNQTAIME